MAPTPPDEFSDYYLVVPLYEPPTGEVLGMSQVWIVPANDSDEAAQAAFDRGYPMVSVIVTEVHKQEG